MSDEEHQFDIKGESGASKTFPQQAGAIRKSGYIVIKGRPCKLLKMTSTATTTVWLRGKVKAVPSGDSLVIMGSAKTELPPEKTITLSSLMAPKLARRGGIDEPFAWESREFLRKLCIGKEVTFRIDYTVPSIGREFGSVFLGDKNVALTVVSEGWAKVRDQRPQRAEASPYLAELLQLEEQAKTRSYGRWTKTPGAAEASIRDLPASAIGDPSNFDAMSLLSANKGKPMEALVEQVRDGSTVRVYLLPGFQFVQVFMAGIQSPSMGRRPAAVETPPPAEIVSDETNGEVESSSSLTTAQRIAASTAVATEILPDPYAREAKHFTEIRVLNRDVRIVLEGVDKFSNLIGSVYYPDGDVAKDLALELVENGLAKYVEWSASMMEEDSKRRLKNAELQTKKDSLRIWINYVPPASNSKAIRDDKFTGKMDRDKLIKMAGAVRTGGKGTVRRKKKAVHRATTTDDKRLQSTLKTLGVNTIPAIEEVNIFKDEVVIHFLNPKVQASIGSNTWVVSGSPQTKNLQDLLPGIINQLGPENLINLRKLAQKFQKQESHTAEEDDDDVPDLVEGETFEEAAKDEPSS